MPPSGTACVHLSVEAGCGGTTWGLQHARDVLSDGNHVVWICEEAPDSGRFSQIFSDTPPSAVSRLHLSAVGDNINTGILSAISLLNVLNNISLVVVDDWTANTGKASAELMNSMQNLIDECVKNEVRLVAISAAYEDASGEGWKSRGDLEGCETWFLHRCTREEGIRELHIGDDVQAFVLTDLGFTPRK